MFYNILRKRGRANFDTATYNLHAPSGASHPPPAHTADDTHRRHTPHGVTLVESAEGTHIADTHRTA
jgi:hypothetical protein